MSPIELYAAVGGRAECLPIDNPFRVRYQQFLNDMPTYTDEESSRENVHGRNKNRVASNVASRQKAYLESMKDTLRGILDEMIAASDMK